MRTHAIILLLGSLAVAVDALCNTNVDNTNKISNFQRIKIDMQSDVIRALLTCANPEEVFEHGQRQYEVLECTDDEWTYGGKSLNPPLPGRTFPKLQCVAKAAPALGHSPKCSKVKPLVGSFHRIQNYITCDSRDEEFVYGQQRYSKISCVNGEWKHGDEPLKPPLRPDETLKVKCVAKDLSLPVASSDCLYQKKGQAQQIMPTSQKLACGRNYDIVYGHHRYALLTCDNGEWKDGDESLDPPVRANEILNIKCVRIELECSGSVEFSHTFVHFLNNDYYCNGYNVFQHGQYFYNHITCDQGEWKFEGKPLIPPVSGYDIDDLKCVPMGSSSYCMYQQKGVAMNINANTQKLDCKTGEEIVYEQQYFTQLTCDNGKWKDGDKPLNPPLEDDQPLAFECVSVEYSCRGSLAFDYEIGHRFKGVYYCHGGYFEHGQYHYDSLTCARGEWRHGEASLIPPVRGDHPFDFKCVDLRKTSDTPAFVTTTPEPAPTTTTTLDPTTTTAEENWTTESGESTEPAVAEAAQLVSTATIVVCVITGIVLIVLAIAALCCYKNAKNRAENSEGEDEKTRKNFEMSDSNMDEV